MLIATVQYSVDEHHLIKLSPHHPFFTWVGEERGGEGRGGERKGFLITDCLIRQIFWFHNLAYLLYCRENLILLIWWYYSLMMRSWTAGGMEITVMCSLISSRSVSCRVVSFYVQGYAQICHRHDSQALCISAGKWCTLYWLYCMYSSRHSARSTKDSPCSPWDQKYAASRRGWGSIHTQSRLWSRYSQLYTYSIEYGVL